MKFFRILVSAFLAGVVFSIGSAIHLMLADESKIAAAFLFSIGMLAVLIFEFKFFAGKIGYIFTEPRLTDNYLTEAFIVLFGNLIGAALTGLALNYTFGDKAAIAANTVLSVSPIATVINSLICGVLMFVAFHGYRRQSGNIIGGMIAIMSTMAMILCGFNNAVTDAFYFAAAMKFNLNVAITIIIDIVGNAVGAVVFAELYEAKKSDEEKAASRAHHHHKRHHSEEE